MKHILIAEFKLESNGFAKGETTIQDYKNRNLVFGDEIFGFFKGVKNEIGGFLDYFSNKSDVVLHPAVAANAIPGPVPPEKFSIWCWSRFSRLTAPRSGWMPCCCPSMAPC